MIEINRNPSRRELLVFGLLLGVFLALVGWIAWWRFEAHETATVLWCLAVALPLLHFLVPAVRRPLYLGWMYAAFPIGWFLSHLLLALIYYVILTPIGLFMRLLGRDPMRRRFDRETDSYWVRRSGPSEPARYFRQF
ncbi:MAG: SxtJ family membrane protein [Planctomycetota bacterium]|jgi:TRAP-type C4-dicarboxylate transport system permease small subunit